MRSPTAVIAALLVVGSATVASADHVDVIPEKIPASDAAFRLELVADGFTTPLWGINAPGSNKQLFVVDQDGKIRAIKTDPGKNGSVPDDDVFLDVGASGLDLLVPLGAFGPGSFDERGLLGLAFHPHYRKNGLVYTFTSEPIGPDADFSTLPDGVDANAQSVIREWRVDNPKKEESVVDPGSSRVLMRIDKPQFNHNGGAIVFDADHNLYIAVGDGGNADDQGDGHADGGNAQDLSDNNVLGKILRIDPQGHNSANGQYGVPSDNPFVGVPGADEIFAYGLRNPFRISVDSKTGELYAADVGQNDIEEVDVIVKGGNYGWPVKEGTFLFEMNGDDPGFTTDDSPGVPADMIDPIAQYDHDEGVSVTGGFFYRGNKVKDLRDTYVFGDFTSSFAGPMGRMFNIDHGELQELLPAGQDGVGMFVTGFGQDRAGELYVMGQQGFTPTGSTGQVFKIVRNTRPDVIDLPTGFRPEGIDSRGSQLYAGSLATGEIRQVDRRTGLGETLVPGGRDRIAVGLEVDRRHGTIWAAGGPSGQAYVYDIETGADVAVVELPVDDQTFINDIVVTRDAAYITDSFRASVYRIPIGDHGAIGTPEVVDLGGEWAQVPGFNANGIEATANGRNLLIINSTTGLLYRVTSRSGHATEVDTGGVLLQSGDGLYRQGNLLYVVQNGFDQIVELRLRHGARRAELLRTLTDDDLDVPTTATISGGKIYAVNARFGIPDPDTAGYQVVKVDR